jgi:isoprenylcysteine carboxyl methyltransferase (ICMT) family protein YpbQ
MYVHACFICTIVLQYIECKISRERKRKRERKRSREISERDIQRKRGKHVLIYSSPGLEMRQRLRFGTCKTYSKSQYQCLRMYPKAGMHNRATFSTQIVVLDKDQPLSSCLFRLRHPVYNYRNAQWLGMRG